MRLLRCRTGWWGAMDDLWLPHVATTEVKHWHQRNSCWRRCGDPDLFQFNHTGEDGCNVAYMYGEEYCGTVLKCMFTVWSPSIPTNNASGARTLLGAPGLAARSKKLLGAPGLTTRSDRTLLAF